jgi:hypothetical protein
LVGKIYGHVKIKSPEIIWLGKRHGTHAHVLCECETCGYRSFIQLSSLTAGASKGCRYCSKQRKIPLWAPIMHKFALDHPEIKYAGTTLSSLFSAGLSEDQIIERYYRKSCKPKGKFGTSLIADPEIASLAKDY